MKRFCFFMALLVMLFSGCATKDSNRAQQQKVVNTIDEAIQASADEITKNLTPGIKIAVLSFKSESGRLSAYVIEELNGYFVQGKKIKVVDRTSLELIRQEMKFQMSGEVSDESAQAIGKMLGAQAIITGSLASIGDGYRFRIYSLNVVTAVREASYMATIKEGSQLSFLMGNSQTSPAQQKRPATTTTTATPAVPTARPPQPAQDASLWKYEEKGSRNAVITGYTGKGTVLTIPSEINGRTVTGIGDNAFKGEGLTSVILPNTIISIGNFAFQENQLTTINIPPNVTSIGGWAFDNNRLTSVVIPNTVTSIGMYAFSKNQLKNVTIPSGLQSLEDSVFANNKLTSVTIPSGVTVIKDSAFEYNLIASVSIPNTVTSISMSAFGTNQLTSVTIPSSVKLIGTHAFYFNDGLTSITIGANVALGEIGKYKAFSAGDFDDFYNNNGKRGGRYTYSNGAWR